MSAHSVTTDPLSNKQGHGTNSNEVTEESSNHISQISSIISKSTAYAADCLDMVNYLEEEGEPNFGPNVKLKRSVNSSLNKLTIENFPTVAERLCGHVETARTKEQLDLIASLTLSKAMSEPDFVEMYADLCLIMSYRTPHIPIFTLPKSSSDRCQSQAFFSSIMIHIWKVSFEKLQFAYENLETDMQTKEKNHDSFYKIKLQLRGICACFAELLIRRIFGLRVLNILLSTVLSPEQPKEFLMEGICRILIIAGSFLDELPAGKLILENSLGRLNELQSQGKLSERLKYYIQEILDTRKVNWHKRIHTEQAKSLAQIEQDVEDADSIGGMYTRLQYGTVIKMGQRRNLLNNPAYAIYIEQQEILHKSLH